MRANRETWRRRVERWAQSGKSAEEFAAAGGFHPETLRQWKYKLRREHATARSKTSLPFLEVLGAATSADARFEIELRRGRRLRVPASFDGETLRRLLAILEEPETP